MEGTQATSWELGGEPPFMLMIMWAKQYLIFWILEGCLSKLLALSSFTDFYKEHIFKWWYYQDFILISVERTRRIKMDTHLLKFLLISCYIVLCYQFYGELVFLDLHHSEGSFITVCLSVCLFIRQFSIFCKEWLFFLFFG